MKHGTPEERSVMTRAVKGILEESNIQALKAIVGAPLVDAIIESKFVLCSRSVFYVEEVMLRDLHNDEDLCYRWLASRRDYPYYRCDPPPVRPSVMRACVAEFCRSNPEFKL